MKLGNLSKMLLCNKSVPFIFLFTLKILFASLFWHKYGWSSEYKPYLFHVPEY